MSIFTREEAEAGQPPGLVRPASQPTGWALIVSSVLATGSDPIADILIIDRRFLQKVITVTKMREQLVCLLLWLGHTTPDGPPRPTDIVGGVGSSRAGR